MAFEITNKAPATLFEVGLPEVHTELADQTASDTNRDLGVVGLKFLRGRIYVKGVGTAAGDIAVLVTVDTVSGLATPEVIADIPAVALASTDTNVCLDFQGWSQDGFQFVTVAITTNTSAVTYDLILDAV